MGRVRAPRLAALLPVAGLIAAVTIAVAGGSRTAAADPVEDAKDPGRLAYVANGEHHTLQVVGPDKDLSQYLAQGQAADDCEASARGGDVVWVSDRSGDEGIYRRTGTGQVATVLVRPGWRITGPKLSPDHQWVAFGSFEDPYGEGRCVGEDIDPESISLWVVRTDGSGLRQVAAHGSSPDWSPDGGRLVYVDDEVAYTVPVAGGVTPRRISPPDSGPVYTPAWEPNGTRIAYVSEDPSDHQQRLALVPATGGGQVVIAAGEYPGSQRDVEWSPDGKRLVFLSGHVYVVDPAQGCSSSCERTRLLGDEVDDGRAFQDVTWYAPDGPPTVLISQEDRETVAIEGVRAHTPVDRLLLRPALDDEFYLDEPAYSPDGHQMVFVAERASTAVFPSLMLGPADQLADAVPVNTGFDELERYGRAAWSPDGTKLAVAHWDLESGNASVTVLDVSAGAAAARALYTVPWPATPDGFTCTTDDRDPAWSPDGGRIAFSRYRFCSPIMQVAPGGSSPKATATHPPQTGNTPSAERTSVPATPTATTSAGPPASVPAADDPSARSAPAAPGATAAIALGREKRHIMTVDAAAGAGLFDLTAAACDGDCYVQDVRPAYRPDGSGVAFTRRGDADPPSSQPPSSSGAVDAVGGAAAPLASAPGYPDSMVLFARTDGAGCRALVPQAGNCPLSPIRPAPDAPFYDPDDPAWSPTGDRLAVDAAVGEGDGYALRIAVLDPATGTGEVLPSTLYNYQQKPTWQPSADLTVTIGGPAAPIVTGATTEITLHVTNGGIADAPGTEADFTLPAGLEAVGDPVPAQGTCTAAGMHCDLGVLAVGQTVDVKVTVRTTSAGTRPVTGTAGSDLLDRNPQDNSASVDVVAADPLRPDPAVTVTVTPPSVLTGDPATVVYTVTNLGNGPATGVALTMSLPPGTTVTSADPACPDPTCALGDLASGASTTVTRVVTSATPLSGNAVGTISSASDDVDRTNNTAMAPLTVRGRPVQTTPPTTVPPTTTPTTTPPTTPPTTVPPTTAPPGPRRNADPAVELTLAPPTAYTGGTGTTARITVRNLGKGRATGLTLALTVPPGVTPDASSPCATAAGCPVADLDPGTSTTLTVALATPGALTGTVTANLSTTGTDTDTRNDTADAPLKVLAPVVTLNPAVGPPGEVTQAVGRGFPPGALLQLRWSQGVTVAAAPVKVAADGTFTAPVLVLVQDALGPRQLLVTDRAAVPRFGEVRADYLVVPGVLQPSGFKWRR